jgi:hypothetical protein
MVTNTHCGLVMLFRRFGEFFAAPYCGKGNFRILRRVDKILNEKTGHMMKFQNPCIILDGVTCSGNYLAGRMFSPKHEYIYWREIWLERVETGDKEVSQS